MDREQKVLVAAAEITRRSEAGLLTSRQDLAAEIPEDEWDAIVLALQDESDPYALGVLLDKEGNEWYYSSTQMQPAYAAALLRVLDRDLLSLLVETVRNESRTYPRATRVELFLQAPFRFTQEELTAVLAQMVSDPDSTDIRRTHASNGTEFLFSDRHLTPFYAGRLAEWEEVESKENP